MQLCNARTRSGNACRRFGNVKNGRCHLHGGKSTGPRTDEGRRRIAKAHFKHGRRSKSYLQQRHDLKAELRAIEADLIKTGLLKKAGFSEQEISDLTGHKKSNIGRTEAGKTYFARQSVAKLGRMVESLIIVQ